MRVALGGDISYQFAVSPQKYLLNVDSNPFEEMPRWEAYIGSIFSVSNGEDLGAPVFGQLSQASMQPAHLPDTRQLSRATPAR